MKVIKHQTNNPFKTELVKLDEPVAGGLFAVIAYRDGHEIHRKDGLNLDAAVEVYAKLRWSLLLCLRLK
jgi:hypothetical protein